MIDARDMAEVERIIRTVADREIRPRFGRLVAADITEKGPGDLVTVADRAAEEALTTALEAMLPGSATVGEEAAHADPEVLAATGGDAPVWIIDPIDGTHNFARHNPRFTTLVALAHRGELLGSWTFAPELELMATARAGAGAVIEGQPVRLPPAPTALRHLITSTPQHRWWSPELVARFNGVCRTGVSLCFFDVSGLEYVELAAGRRQAMLVTWEYPWDHAAGLLLHAEAGGVSLAGAGPFRLAGGNELPFVVAPDLALARQLRDAMAEGLNDLRPSPLE
jgi:fructose-1,6-bisphosphatase/inositol monophosphatase family enzyme